jgi:hypothetical protein
MGVAPILQILSDSSFAVPMSVVGMMTLPAAVPGGRKGTTTSPGLPKPMTVVRPVQLCAGTDGKLKVGVIPRVNTSAMWSVPSASFAPVTASLPITGFGYVPVRSPPAATPLIVASLPAANASKVYATRSGDRSGSYEPHVLVSRNYGASWTDLSGNLPQAPVNDVVLSRGNIVYVATDQGVFVSPQGADRWQRLGRGLPLVPVDDIEHDAGHHRLVAGTFGRSMYEIDVP